MNASALLARHTVIADPPLARFLFSDTRMAIVWLVLRVYVGYSWATPGGTWKAPKPPVAAVTTAPMPQPA